MVLPETKRKAIEMASLPEPKARKVRKKPQPKPMKDLTTKIKVLEDREIKLSCSLADQSRALSALLGRVSSLEARQPVLKGEFIKFMVGIGGMIDDMKTRLDRLEAERMERDLSMSFDPQNTDPDEHSLASPLL